MLLRLASGLDWINRVVGGIVLWFALGMVLLQFVLVILRYVFGIASIFWSELVLYLHAGLFMLGAGYTLWVDGHVRVDIFQASLSERARAAIDIFGHLVLLAPTLIVLMVWSWPMVRRSWAILEGPVSVGGVPASFLLKSLVPAFCGLLLLQALANLLRTLITVLGGRDAA